MTTDARPVTPADLADRYRARMARLDVQAARALDVTYRTVAAGLERDAAALIREAQRQLAAGTAPEQVARRIERSDKLRRMAERYTAAAARWAGDSEALIREAALRGRAAAVRDAVTLFTQVDLFPEPPSIPEDVIASALSLLEPTPDRVALLGIEPDSATGEVIGRTIEAAAAAAAPTPPVRALLSEYGEQVAADASRVLLDGIARGRNPRVIARAMQDVGVRPLTRARTIARTEVLRAYRDSSRATWSANPDAVQGWVWWATLDARTCASCMAQHGGFHPATETMATHPNCRCAMVPVPAGREHDTREWSDAGDRWLSRQPEATQRAMLGRSGAAAFRGGRVRLRDFVRRTDSPVWGPGTGQAPLRQALDTARQRGAGAPRG